MNNITRFFGFASNIRRCGKCLQTQRLASKPVSKLSTNASVTAVGKQKETFHDVLPGIMESIARDPKFKEVPDVTNWIKKVLEYNLAGGKLARGLSTVMSYEMLEKPEKLSEDTVHLARLLGWCVEMLQAYLLMLDDIMDGSQKRRGLPCWYLLPDVGMGAINDSILVYTCMNQIITSNVGHLPRFFDIMNEFNEALLFTSVGQHLDYAMAHRNKNDYTQFTAERYDAIVKYKTSYYTYKLPVALGMLLANITDKTYHSKAERICFEIGRIFQMQDDYIDVFGVESVTGKLGTDIQEGKCSWLAVTALQQANDAQRKVFTACYGSPEPAHVERIKRLYQELDIPTIYREEERVRRAYVVKLAQDFGTSSGTELFLKLLDSIHNRVK